MLPRLYAVITVEGDSEPHIKLITPDKEEAWNLHDALHSLGECSVSVQEYVLG